VLSNACNTERAHDSTIIISSAASLFCVLIAPLIICFSLSGFASCRIKSRQTLNQKRQKYQSIEVKTAIAKSSLLHNKGIMSLKIRLTFYGCSWLSI